MTGTAAQLFAELERGERRPFYLIHGSEPFQAREILDRIRAKLVPADGSAEFLAEHWDGEGLDGGALRRSLDTLPGLFGEGTRFVVCVRFDKVSPSALMAVESYFDDPSPTTTLVLTAEKADKRKGWYKAVEASGFVVDVTEPKERDWPKWQGYFERRVGKRMAPGAWELLVAAGQRQLAAVATEVEKAALYVGDAPTIDAEAATRSASPSSEANVFEFVENVVLRRKFEALRGYECLRREGEADVKLLALLVRQFQLVEKAKHAPADKPLAAHLGVHPFVAQKVVGQARQLGGTDLTRTFQLLADGDFALKTGRGDLFGAFLVPYFAS
jgi:DNA polymerase-3 subunit delta